MRTPSSIAGALVRRTTVQSLGRGLDILDAIAREDRPLGITDLSRRLGLAKGSVTRLVTTLAQRGCLFRDPETTKYRLGIEVWRLGNAAMPRIDVRTIAHPVMERLNAITAETVHLTVLTEAGEMVFLDKIDSTRAVRPHIELGARLPPHCVANGKAVLAFRPLEQVERLIGPRLQRFTETTITRKEKLLAELDRVRRLGYAVNQGEYLSEASGLAAPIRDHSGLAIAALGISVPTNRLDQALICATAGPLVKGAREISAALGCYTEYRESTARETLVHAAAK